MISNKDIQEFLTHNESKKTPPGWVYLSEEWFKKEESNFFSTAWHFFCLSHEIPKKGDFKTRVFYKKSILVIRNKDERIEAFFNSCRHRGSPLTDSPSGRMKSIVCPYHKWGYRLDGKLIKTQESDTPQQPNNCSLDLKKINVSEAHGMVFINLSESENTCSLEEYLGNFCSLVAEPHNIYNMRRVHEKNYELNSNWKLYVEVDMETLHTPHIHKSSIGSQPVEELESKGEWIGVYNRSNETVALKPDMRDKGFYPNKGSYGKGLTGTHFSIIYPGFFIVVTQDCMWWIQKTAMSAEKVSINVGYCFPKETIERKDFDEIPKLYFERLDQVIKEDDWITEYQQKGLYDEFRGVYTDAEKTVLKLDKHILAKTLGQ